MSRRRRSIRYPLLIAVAGTTAAIVAYIFGLPHLQARDNPLVSPSELVVPRAIDVVVFLWCFWVGSSVGSFLNVVAWRMPRGETINGRSHCPRCQAQLRARDNIPIFGWLALGGRCYRCRLPISIRYPIVEAAVGSTITAVAVAEIYQLNLPREVVHVHNGPFRAPVVDGKILLTVLYHSAALAVAWACGLIRLDGNRLPGKLVGWAAMLTVLPMLAYPALMVVPWQMRVGPSWRPDGLYVDAIVRLVTAFAAATILARYLARGFCPDADPKLDPLGRSTTRLIDLIVILSIPAIVVGWQASIAVTVIAAIFAVGLNVWLRPPREALGRFAIAVPLALAFQLVFWRHLHAPTTDRLGGDGSWYWPSDNGQPWVVLAWVVAVMLIPFWLRDDPPRRQVSDAADASVEALHETHQGHEEDDDDLTDQALAGRDRG